MAKGKKKENLTLEEKLERALVPREEWPYEVPGNWCWVKWGSVGKFTAGSGFKNDYQGFAEYDIPFYKVGSLKYSDSNGYIYDQTNTVNEQMRKELKSTIIPVDSILFAKIGEAIRLNRRCLNRVPCCIDNNMMAFTTDIGSSKYIYYWSLGLDLYVYTNATTVPAIRKSDLEDIPFPFPPLEEQQRIVARIEKLFFKLNEAKEKVQEALDGFEERKTAILHKAFSGELTKRWREERGIGIDSWLSMSLKDTGKWFGGGTPNTSVEEYWNNGNIPWITPKDMKDKIIDDSMLHITMTGVENSSANYCDKPAVLFVMRSGILRRVFPVCMVRVPFTVNQDLKVCIPNDSIIQEYLYWACVGNEKNIRETCMKSGTTVESVETKKFMDFNIPVATIEEQREIVKRIEILMVKEEHAKYNIEKLLEHIELMRKSILVKAFRGELGTNDVKEESSNELLKHIL